MEKSSAKELLSFEDDKGISGLREKTARKMFVFFAFIFFLSYFFIGVSFYENIFSLIISKAYFLFVISGVLFLFFLIKNSFKNIILKYFLWFIIVLITIFALLPFFVSKEIILIYLK